MQHYLRDMSSNDITVATCSLVGQILIYVMAQKNTTAVAGYVLH